MHIHAHAVLCVLCVHMHMCMYMYESMGAHVHVLYYPTRLDELQTWLLDEDACKTEWQTLLDLRARHAPRHAQYRMVRPLSARRPLKGSASEGTQH